MNLTQWFRDQLQASADGFIWGVEQVPPERRSIQPPGPSPFGEWPATRHLIHLINYEEVIALPSMRQWLGAPRPVVAAWDDTERWDGGWTLERLVDRFRGVRAEQIGLLAEFDDRLWAESREAIWGPVALQWVVSKTYQHTLEHTDTVLRQALFWDFFVARHAAQRAG